MRSSYYFVRSVWAIARDTRGDTTREARREFERAEDPWNYATSAEELERYAMAAALIGTLGSVESALEVGCAEGLFTRALCDHAEAVLAVDAVEMAVERTRSRCAGIEKLSVRRWDAREEPLQDRFDLVLCMDVMDQLSTHPLEQRRAMKAVTSAVRANGSLLLTACLQHPVIESANWARYLGVGAHGILGLFLTIDPRLTLRDAFYTDRHLVALCTAQQ